MPLAALFLPNWRNIMRLRFPSMSNLMLLLLGVFGVIWLYILWNPLTAYEIRLFAFITALIICFSSLNHDDIDLSRVIKKVWIVSLICAIVGYYIDQSGLFLRLSTGHDESIASIATRSKLVVGNGCCVGIAAALCYPASSKRMNWIVLVSIALEFIVVLLVGKRTPMIASLCCIVFYMIRRTRFSSMKIWGRVIISFAVLAIAYLILDSTLQLTERIVELHNYTVTGIHDALNGTTTSGNTSARYRYKYINNGVNYISQQFNWYNYIVGGGTNAAFMTDVPILQAFVDMGIFGLFAYGGYVVFLPVWAIFSKKGKSDYVFFAALLCVYNVISCLNSGHPYSLPKWAPSIFLVYTLAKTYSVSKHSKQISQFA